METNGAAGTHADVLPTYLYVTPFFPSADSWRGAYSFDFVQALRRTGRFDVRVFVPGEGPDYDYQGVHVRRFATKQWPGGIFPLTFAKWNQQSFLERITSAGIDLTQIAVCHGNVAPNAIYPLIVQAANPHCLTLLHHHDLASFGLNSSRLRTFWPHQALMYPQLLKLHEAIDCHVFVSKVAKSSFLSAPDSSWTIHRDYIKQMRGLSFFRSPNIRNALVLHNGVDRSQFFAKPSEIEGSPNRRLSSKGPSAAGRSDSFRMGAIGNFNTAKDHMSLLRACVMAADELGDWTLRLVGSGPTLAACRAFVRRHSLEEHVSFEIEVQHNELPDFYRSLDLFVLPSYFEGFGCVFTEAAACGVPFITCEGQGMDDLIPPEQRSSWLCQAKSPGDLSEKILTFFRGRAEQRLCGPIDINVLVSRFAGQVEDLLNA